MYVEPRLIKEEIRAQGMRHLWVGNLSGEKWSYRGDATPDQLCALVDQWILAVDVPFMIKGWCDGSLKDTGGRNNEKRAECSWTVHGTKGQHQRPIAGAREIVAPMAAPIGPDIATAVKVAELTIRNEHAAQRIAELEERVNGEGEGEEEEEEEEEEERSMDPETIREIRMLFRDLRGGVSTPDPARIGADKRADVPEKEELFRAIERLKADDPGNFKVYMDNLMNAYGDQAVKSAQQGQTGTDGDNA